MEATGVAAFDGPEPVGFVAVMPRWMRVGDRRLAVSVLSSLAVRPAWRGPVSLDLYEKLVEVIQQAGRPVLIFVRPGSAGERRLLWVFDRAGFRARSLGIYRTYGIANAAEPARSTARVEEGHEAAFLEVAGRCRDESVLWRDPGPDQLRHYRADPRGCALAVIHDPAGRPVGTALVVLSQVVVPRGIERVPMIDCVFLPRPRPEALRALIDFARHRWEAQATVPVVTAANLNGIDPAVIRAAGLRATHSVFQGYLFDPRTDPLSAAIAATNLEII
jgi:hypothetical protein